jgi:hypothetical protein
MAKALVAIGVGKTAGSFPTLKGAVKDAQSFYAWGRAQGFDCRLFIDQGRKKVRVVDIFDAIDKFVRAKIYSQIVVYFSGHGILKAPDCELWLMSGAPRNPNEVVNVYSSVTNARGSGIEHVVFISDACRSLPTELSEASLHGQDLFSYIRSADPMPEVDVFYATLPGNVALEVPPDATNQRDRGLLTHCLLEALEGRVPEVIHPFDERGVTSRVVPCRPLKAWLSTAVPLAAEAICFRLQQKPDSRIESDASKKYLARLSDPATLSKLRPSLLTTSDVPTVEKPAARHEESGPRRLVPSRMGTGTGTPVQQVPARKRKVLAEKRFPDLAKRDKSVNTIANASALQRMTTGVVVKGAVISSAVRSSGLAELATDGRDSWIDIEAGQVGHTPQGYGEAIALRFANGTGTVLAVIPGYVATVVMEEGRIATINYTPGIHSRNHVQYLQVAEQLELRRAAVAVAAGNGTFSTTSSGSMALADYVRFLKRIDPTLGVYACYAYARVGQFSAVSDIYDVMAREPEPVPFDVVMLAQFFTATEYPMAPPGMPMMTQGWMSMGRCEQLLPVALVEARKHTLPSLWASFTADGMNILERYITCK